MMAIDPILSARAAALPAAGGMPVGLENPNDARLRETAREFEAAFIAQMLNYSGLSDALSANGGFGGEAFSSLLIEQYAVQLVDQGGFGLADSIYEQLRDKEPVDGGWSTA